MSDGPLATYRSRRSVGLIRYDSDQELAVEKLEMLHHALQGYKPDTGDAGWRARLGLARRRGPAPQGLYIYGGVGRGKSMLMDLFYFTAPVEKKRRVHFHRFMLDVHEYLHQWRRAWKAAANEGKTKGNDDALPELARQIAQDTWLLCFDEFHVTDIADAMILGRLFTLLFDYGVVMVATSNWAPDMLYKDGLQRDRFLPFIALLKEKVDILALDGGVDYRVNRLNGLPVYYHPLGLNASKRVEEAFHRLSEGQKAEAMHLLVQNRRVDVPLAANGVAWLYFYDLCCKPLGAADYLGIATHFHTVIIDQVPMMGMEQRNEARRFTNLIDALYEHKVNVVISADAPPERLYTQGTHAFEFERTVSRLMEMQSKEYLALPHLT
ncbi:cell division protein ZapE [Azospirillaceae bacterium]